MKYIITISNDTLVAINNHKATSLALKNHDQQIATIEQTLLLPSGKARKGGRKELNDANVVRQHLVDESTKASNVASRLLREATNAFTKERCLTCLEAQADTNDTDVGAIYRAAVLAFQDLESGKHTIRIDNPIAGYGFDYDVFCSYSDNYGLVINITKHNEGRSISGGIVNVRRKYQPYTLEDERMSVVDCYINDSGTNLVVDVPPSYVDGGYVVAVNQQDEQTPEEAQTTARLIAAMAHICQTFNGLKLACFDYASSNILYK